MNLNDLHQLPDNHPVAQRARISLAHIDVAADLRRNRERVARNQAGARATSLAAAASFAIGQSVAMKNNRNNVGRIVAIDDTKVSIEIGGAVRVFNAGMLVAA